MGDIKRPAVVIHAFSDGSVECVFDEAHYGETIAYLSQAVCGAFDVAGEHEKEVREALCLMAQDMTASYFTNDIDHQ